MTAICRQHSIDCATTGSCKNDAAEREAVYWITASGGREWERERRPAWDRLVYDRYGEHRSGKPTATILAASLDIGNQFWHAGVDCGLFEYTDGRFKTRTVRNYPMIHWRSPFPVFVIHAVLDDWCSDTNWDKLEVRRTWLEIATRKRSILDEERRITMP